MLTLAAEFDSRQHLWIPLSKNIFIFTSNKGSNFQDAEANISYNVQILDEPHAESLAQDDIKTLYQQLDPSDKMIVFPGTTDRCDKWAEGLGFYKYHAKLDDSRR